MKTAARRSRLIDESVSLSVRTVTGFLNSIEFGTMTGCPSVRRTRVSRMVMFSNHALKTLEFDIVPDRNHCLSRAAYRATRFDADR